MSDLPEGDRYGPAPTGLTELLRRYGLWVFIGLFALWGMVAHPDQFAVGLVVGSVLALASLGLTLIYGVLNFAHFAHGDAMMLGAYLAFTALTGEVMGVRNESVAILPGFDLLPGATEPLGPFSFGYGLVLAVPVAAVVLSAALVAIDQVLYRRLRDRGAGLAIFAVASLGVAIAMRSVMLMIWGPDPRSYVPGIRPTVDLLGVRLVTDQLFILATAGVLTAATYYLLYRTRTGRAMRAMADNADLARVVGIDTERVVRWTWITSGFLTAVAGILLALQSQLKPEFGFLLLLPVFAATIAGGIGSPQGALVGGLIVGIVQEVAVTLGFLSPGYKFSVAFVLLIIVILVRPRGLFDT